jgi:hypothetical protein
MPLRKDDRETLPQNTGHPTRDTTHDKWRNSILVGPQTAGIPTVHNADEWARDGDQLSSNNDMVPPETHDESGALEYFKTQRRR